jgi:hypothetical protein
MNPREFPPEPETIEAMETVKLYLRIFSKTYLGNSDIISSLIKK